MGAAIEDEIDEIERVLYNSTSQCVQRSSSVQVRACWGGGLLHNVLSIVPFVGGRSACWGSHVAFEASCALRMVCSHLLLLTGVLTLFTVIVVCGSLFKFVVMRGGVQSPCLVLEPAHGGGNGSRSPRNSQDYEIHFRGECEMMMEIAESEFK